MESIRVFEVAFRELLLKRNIDGDALLRQQPAVYRRWLEIFSANHPDSFLGLVRNEINRVRRELKDMPVQRVQDGRDSAHTHQG
jgi:hypothetical protein